PEIPERWREAHRRAMAGEVVVAKADRLERRSGSTQWLHWEVQPWRDANGTIGGIAIYCEDITDRKQIEEKLIEREAYYRRLFAMAPSGILLEDRAGKILDVNDAICRMLGYSRDEVVGKDVRMLIPEECRTAVAADIERVLSVGSVSHVVTNLTKDGSLRSMEIREAPIELPNREMGIVVVSDDITERLETERALHESEERLRKVFENAATGISIADWDGRIINANPAFQAIVGYTEAELRQLQFGALVHPDDRRENVRLVRSLQAGERNFFDIENRYMRKDGETAWVHKYVSALRADDGAPSHLIALVTDVSARRRSQEALQASEERMRAILNTAADAIVTIDNRGTIVTVNPATEAMFGYEPGELPGRNVAILMPSPYSAEHDRYIGDYLATGEAKVIGRGRELTGRRKDGSTFPIAIAVSEVGRHQLFTGVISDVSERKELQKLVLSIAADEDRRIGMELHDSVQQQLTGMGLLAESLVESAECGEASLAKTARRLACGLKQVNHEIHQLARGLIPVDVDPEGLRAALQRLASQTAKIHEVDCQLTFPSQAAVADAFVATHLFRIAQEAVTNAVKHGAANRIELSLACENRAVVLRICDDGVGLSPSDASEEACVGVGMRLMKYRAEIIGGTLSAQNRSTGGVVVECRLSERSCSLGQE
ncbi:MAG: PAS domain S-box protein, partial [Planctomycetales bacterium]|nr:PAS domain S-box protein [Planctomycetales bacterium]